MSTALVTGMSGFTGPHLARELRAAGYDVVGLDRAAGCDLLDRDAVQAFVAGTRPDVVIHLAALLRATDPTDLYDVNVKGTVNLLDGLVTLPHRPRVLIVGSSAVYGPTPEGRPVSERRPPRPLTHYGASKLAQELVARRYVEAGLLSVVTVRTFNLLGPGLPASLACGAFVDAIVRIERDGRPGTLSTGRTSTARDFTDVRDAARGYRLALERGRSGAVYNVCSGVAVPLQRCLDLLTSMARTNVVAVQDPALLQAQDLPAQVGDAHRLRAVAGWEPRVALEQSLADMLAVARGEAAA